MAHETLKATIRQYIGPNGQNSITGQIMQDILIAMVDEYPNISGYATQSWVTTQLGSYLPLTGGTLTGALMTSGTTQGIQLRAYFDNDTIAIQKYENNDWVSVCSLSGPGYITGSTYHGNQYIVNNGTSSQFMKADGSLDSNTYITASALTGYATQSWVTTQLGSYLPLAGGTITGNLTVDGSVKFNSNLTFAYDRGIKFGTDNYVHINRDNRRLLIINEAGDDIIIGDYDDTNYTSFANDLQGVICNTNYYISNTTWSIFNDGTAQFKSVSQSSDLRKKTIIGDVPINIYNVANAPLFKFTWNEEKKYSGQHIGSAAQYWQTVLPELVSIGRDADMTLAMQYDVIALASAITVAKTVVNHEERIILLERENEALKKEIADLKSA